MSFMGFSAYVWLGYEFLRPKQAGFYYDGEKLTPWPEWPERPARAYVALSHATLYFQQVKLPKGLPEGKAAQALKLEAARLLRLLEGKEPGEVSVSILPLGGGEFLLAFQEKEKLTKALEALPARVVPCGVFPAWVALLAWFKKQGPLEDGLYLVEGKQGVEGFEWREGRIVRLIPSSAKAAAAFLEESSLPQKRPEGVEAGQVLAEGAFLAPQLLAPSEMAPFDLVPLRLRPKLPKKALLLWLLPFCVYLAGEGLEAWQERLYQERASLKAKLEQLKKQEKALSQRLERRSTLQELARYVEEFEKRPPLLEALVELARILPPGSWVRRFYFLAPDTVKLWGESENALEVIKRLEESPYFSDVKVLSSITKHPRTGKEHFALQAKLEKSTRENPAQERAKQEAKSEKTKPEKTGAE